MFKKLALISAVSLSSMAQAQLVEISAEDAIQRLSSVVNRRCYNTPDRNNGCKPCEECTSNAYDKGGNNSDSEAQQGDVDSRPLPGVHINNTSFEAQITIPHSLAKSSSGPGCNSCGGGSSSSSLAAVDVSIIYNSRKLGCPSAF